MRLPSAPAADRSGDRTFIASAVTARTVQVTSWEGADAEFCPQKKALIFEEPLRNRSA
jgi:hypothetical protein